MPRCSPRSRRCCGTALEFHTQSTAFHHRQRMRQRFQPMNYVAHNPVESIAHALFHPLGAGGVYARTGLFEQVIDGLTALISRYRPADAEIFRFPPVTSRAQVEKSGYLKSFPHLLGCVSCLAGTEQEIRAVVDAASTGKDWVGAL